MSIDSKRSRQGSARLFLYLTGSILIGSSWGCAHQRPQPTSVLIVEVEESHLDAQVYVDGNYVGNVVGIRSAGPPGGVPLAPGVHRVEVRKPGHFPVQRTVRVERRPPATTIVHAELLEDPR